MKVLSLTRIGIAVTLMISIGTVNAENFWTKSYEPAQPFDRLEEAMKRFQTLANDAKSNPLTKIDPYLRSGILVSDIACDNWLTMLGRSERDADVAKSIINIIGNLIIGVAGINGANPGSLAKGSLGLSAFNASVDTFKNEVLLGTIADIQAKLHEGRRITAATIRLNPPENYDDAQGMLLSYHNECSPNAIKVLLRTSLSAVKYKPADTTLSEAQLEAKARIAGAELSTELYGNEGFKLSDDILYRLYVTEMVVPVNEPGFVKQMKRSDLAEISKSFNEKNVQKRRALLEVIASAKKFPQRFIKEADVATAAIDEKVRLEENRVVEEGKKVLNAPQPALAAVSQNELQAIKSVASGATDTAVSEESLSTASRAGEKLAASKSTQIATTGRDILNMVDAQKNLNEARDSAESIQAIPTPKIDAKAESRLRGEPPISVNAVLVPITTN